MRISLDESKSRKYQELSGGEINKPDIEHNSDNFKDTDSINLRPDTVHIFDDPSGFTAAIVILDANKDLVYKIFSNPESYIRLSPNIVYISLKDETKTIMHSKLHVDLTFLRRRWFFWELAETVEGVFSWESTQYEVTLKITYRSGSDIIFTYHIENHPLGTQVVSKVRFAKTKSKIMFWNPFNLYGSCSKLLGNSLQKEQTQLLLNLRDYVQDKSAMDMYRDQVNQEIILSANEC